MSLIESIYASLPVPLQSQMISLAGWRLKRRRFNRTYRDARALLARTESGDRPQVIDVQNELLRTLVQRAATEVPYYRDLFKKLGVSPHDIQEVEDLQRLPILAKDTVRERRQDLISERYSRRKLIYAHTSGSTGAGLKLFWDHNVDAWTNAVLWRHREWVGVPFGTRYATLFGRVIHSPSRTKGPFWRRNQPWNQFLFSTFHLADENLDSYIDEMARLGIEALEAYPSAAYVLAHHLRERGRLLPLRAVFTTTEPLLDIHRELIEERFDCPVYDYFAAAERGIFAAECEQQGGLHAFDEYGVSEVVDSGGQPVLDGQSGRLILTNLHNFAMPLLRYDIGDVSGFKSNPCACGRPLRLLHDVTTKQEDLLRLPDGRTLPPSALTHAFKPLDCIAKSQVVQEDLHTVVVSIVPKAGYGPETERTLLASLRRRLGAGIEVTVRTVEEIPRGPRGKFRWVVSRVSSQAQRARASQPAPRVPPGPTENHGAAGTDPAPAPRGAGARS